MRHVLGAALLALAQTSHAATLGDLLQAAWERQDRQRPVEARRAEIEARGDAARALFAGPPTLALANRNDRLNGDRGKWENEVELAAPLWLAGQREARQRLAAAELDENTAAATAARLALAGELRALVWQAQSAREELELQQQRYEAARRLTADVARRVDAGELARVDRLAAESEVVQAQAQVTAASTRYGQALQRLRALTGHETLPTPLEETVGERALAHPSLEAARQALARAQAKHRLSVQSERDPPEVGIQLRRDRETYGVDARDSVRFAVRIPLATSARNRPLQAAAAADIAEAAGGQRRREIELEAEDWAATLALESAARQVELGERRHRIAVERLALLRRAFEFGELGLAELLRADSAVREAELELARARTDRGYAIARLNQARGILP